MLCNITYITISGNLSVTVLQLFGVQCRHTEYRAQLTTSADESAQTSVKTFFSASASTAASKYSNGHSQQKAITSSIIQDLIINCDLPISIVENTHFRHFLSIVDSKYAPVSRTYVNSVIQKMVVQVKTSIQEKLTTVKAVNLTLDIWSDRKMRSYLGITAHFVPHNSTGNSNQLQSLLLCCDRIEGSHTGEKIASEVEQVLDFYNIRHSVDYVITDNAANMRKAMTLTLQAIQSTDDPNGMDEDEDVDDPEMWENLNEADADEVNSTVTAHCRFERLSCFDHTLNLTVGDGLKESRCVATAVAKSCKITSLLHTSATFKGVFEQAFGTDKSLPAAVSTRWNSTLRQLKAVIGLDMKELAAILEAHGHNHLVLSSREHSQLAELVDVLDPFLEATLLTEGEKVVTISFALPSVLSLIKQLQEMIDRQQLKFCNPVAKELLKSLRHRFRGMLLHLQVQPVDDVSCMAFGSDIYIISAFFDPRFKFQWVETSTTDGQSQVDVQTLLNKLHDIVRAFVKTTNALYKCDTATSAGNDTQETATTSEPPRKKSKLFGTIATTQSNSTAHCSLSSQLTTYMSLDCEYDPEFDCFAFWQQHRRQLDKLYYPALRALSAPASSSPVERVFSKGGLIMRPLRSKLSDARVSALIFLKCNDMKRM